MLQRYAVAVARLFIFSFMLYRKMVLAFNAFIGPYMTVKAVWTIADIFNGLMAIPNLIALLALNGVVVAETKIYLDGLKKTK